MTKRLADWRSLLAEQETPTVAHPEAALVTASATDLRLFLSQQSPAGRKTMRDLYLQSGPGKI